MQKQPANHNLPGSIAAGDRVSAQPLYSIPYRCTVSIVNTENLIFLVGPVQCLCGGLALLRCGLYLSVEIVSNTYIVAGLQHDSLQPVSERVTNKLEIILHQSCMPPPHHQLHSTVHLVYPMLLFIPL